MLAAYPWRFHHETLRELVENADELRAVRDRLTEKLEHGRRDNAARARLLSLRAVVSRILGDLGKALADGKLALAHAEATGELRRIAIAQARLAHVLQWRGDFAEADRLFAEANSVRAARPAARRRCTSTPAGPPSTRAATWRRATTSSRRSTCARSRTRS